MELDLSPVTESISVSPETLSWDLGLDSFGAWGGWCISANFLGTISVLCPLLSHSHPVLWGSRVLFLVVVGVKWEPSSGGFGWVSEFHSLLHEQLFNVELLEVNDLFLLGASLHDSKSPLHGRIRHLLLLLRGWLVTMGVKSRDVRSGLVLLKHKAGPVAIPTGRVLAFKVLHKYVFGLL